MLLARGADSNNRCNTGSLDRLVKAVVLLSNAEIVRQCNWKTPHRSGSRPNTSKLTHKPIHNHQPLCQVCFWSCFRFPQMHVHVHGTVSELLELYLINEVAKRQYLAEVQLLPRDLESPWHISSWIHCRKYKDSGVRIIILGILGMMTSQWCQCVFELGKGVSYLRSDVEVPIKE